jgi:hypothetical protein
MEAMPDLVIVCMSWSIQRDGNLRYLEDERDSSLDYWIRKLGPVIKAEREKETVVVFCNRCGIDGKVYYAGTCAVIGIKQGQVIAYGILGRGKTELLVADTKSSIGYLKLPVTKSEVGRQARLRIAIPPQTQATSDDPITLLEDSPMVEIPRPISPKKSNVTRSASIASDAARGHGVDPKARRRRHSESSVRGFLDANIKDSLVRL